MKKGKLSLASFFGIALFFTVSSLMAMPPLKPEEVLIQDLSSQNLEVVLGAIDGLATYYPYSPDALPLIKELLEDPRPRVIRTAARALGRLHAEVNEENIAHICELLKSSDVDTELDGLKSLTGLAAPESVPKILPLLNSPSIPVIRIACRALGVLGNKETIPFLEPLLKHKKSNVREDAKRAIEALNNDKSISGKNDSQKKATAELDKSKAAYGSSLDYSLFELGTALHLFEAGDYLDADVHFGNATKVMNKITDANGQEVAAVVADEGAKTFKGEPYERATAFFYRGLCRFNNGDYSGALAAFRSSLASDEETRNSNRKLLQDFTISHFMAALCYDKLGELQNATATLAVASSNAPASNRYLAQQSLKQNFIAIIGVGEGPFKIAARSYEIGTSPERKIELAFDEGSPATADEATDLLFQAKSQMWGQADSARVARKVGKAIISAVISGALSGLGGGNVNVNIQDYDDIRSWQHLPLKFYIFTANLPPGTHTITMKAYDEKGKEIERDRQTWVNVPVSAEPSSVLYLRTKRNLQNQYGYKQVKLNSLGKVPAN